MPMRNAVIRGLTLAVLVLLPSRSPAEEKPKPASAVEEKVSRTQHAFTLAGQRIAYTATAGTLVLRDEKGGAAGRRSSRSPTCGTG